MCIPPLSNLKKMAKKIQKKLDNDVIITSEEALLLSL